MWMGRGANRQDTNSPNPQTCSFSGTTVIWPSMTPLDRFMASVTASAQQLGITCVAIAAKDPATGEIRFVASKTAPSELRGTVADKWGLMDGAETGWDG